MSLLLDSWQRTAQRAGDHTWLDGTVCAAASPLEGLLAAGVRAIEDTAARLARQQRLTAENTALRARAADLRARLAALEEEKYKTNRERDLRAAAGLDPHPPIATVIGWGEDGWTSYLILDCGTRAGVRARDIALAPEGVVGQVYAASPTTARVLPLTDPGSGVAALVQRSRERGILKGRGAGRCELRYLDPDSDIARGDLVLTSGLGGIFPKGLIIGTVESVRQDRGTLGKVAMVRPAVRLTQVEVVALVRAPAVGP
jgi:rod shape-determining protein MreC